MFWHLNVSESSVIRKTVQPLLSKHIYLLLLDTLATPGPRTTDVPDRRRLEVAGNIERFKGERRAAIAEVFLPLPLQRSLGVVVDWQLRQRQLLLRLMCQLRGGVRMRSCRAVSVNTVQFMWWVRHCSGCLLQLTTTGLSSVQEYYIVLRYDMMELI